MLPTKAQISAALMETICMKCQIQFWGRHKYFNMSSAEKFTQSAKC